MIITLSPEDSSSDCAAVPDPRAVSFSTSVAPATSYCYNLDELFAPNNTGRHLTVSGGPLSYTLTNSDSYDFSANYSRLRYHQTNRTGNGDSGAGQNAAIALNVYPDRDCRTDRPGGDDAPPDTPIWNFYGWSCQSAEDGQCRTTEYAIKSLLSNDASGINERDG